MGLYWWFWLLTCISCCILSEAEDYGEQVLNDASATPTEGSLHGFRPCLDDTCSASDSDAGDEALTWSLLSTVISAQKFINQIFDSVRRNPDIIVNHCMDLHSGTVEHISSIEERRPDIKDIKMKVFEDFIGFISDFTFFNTTDCDSTMSLISYMSLAIRSLHAKYSQHCGERCNCVYTTGVEEHMPTTTDSIQTTESIDQSASTLPPLGNECSQAPCPEDAGHDSYEEVYAEDQDHSSGSSKLVGSIRGVPGVDFPNYTDIPLTSFSCADKKYIPGFYADLETGCQVFHVCYEHRRESFLCPLGTTFNQPILACDYWYSSNCSLAKDYYEVNVKSEEEIKEEEIQVIKEIIEETEVVEDHSESTDKVYEQVDTKPSADSHGEINEKVDIRVFLPVKAKVTDFEKPLIERKESETVGKQAVLDVQEVASQIFDKIVSTATDVASKTRGVIDKVPEPEMQLKPSSLDLNGAKLKPIILAKKLAGVKLAAVPASKIAPLKSAIPFAKFVAAKKVLPLAVKTAIPVAAKAAAVKTAIPVAAKAAAVKTAIPVAAKAAAVKTAIPVAAKAAAVKTAIPVAAKAAAVKTAVPVAAKASAVKATIPVAAKAKLLAFPAKKFAISGFKVAAAVPKLAVPVLKSKILAPALKGKVLKPVAVPVLKAKVLPIKGSVAALAPKAKLIKTAAISPLTKKTLALGYMKLLKAKKLVLMG